MKYEFDQIWIQQHDAMLNTRCRKELWPSGGFATFHWNQMSFCHHSEDIVIVWWRKESGLKPVLSVILRHSRNGRKKCPKYGIYLGIIGILSCRLRCALILSPNNIVTAMSSLSFLFKSAAFFDPEMIDFNIATSCCAMVAMFHNCTECVPEKCHTFCV